MRRPGSLRVCALLGCLAVSTAPARTQEILLLKSSRRPLRGSVFERGAETIAFNPYFSTHAAMVHGVTEYPRSKVKEVRKDIPPHETFWLELGAHRADADALCKLADACKDRRLKTERLVALEQVLRVDAAHPLALKAYSRFKAEKFVKTDPVANARLGEQMRSILQVDDAAARHRQAEQLIKDFALDVKPTWFARAHRSGKQPKGTHHGRKVTLRADKLTFEYTLHVPASYDPLVPAPLLVVLHGGGPGGPTGVIGSGKLALTIYAPVLPGRDYIVVCPTAKAAPWSQPVNDGVVTTLVEELLALYNIDENRVYLTGHSMGGYGTWHFGPKYCETWAAIGPTCGGGSNGLKRLRDSQTFVYLFHGGNDNVVSPGDSRAAAAQMLKDGNDFVYTELPDTGHSCPDSVVKEMFDLFDRKRLAIKGRRTVRPRSSFLRPESKDERQYFGRLIPK